MSAVLLCFVILFAHYITFPFVLHLDLLWQLLIFVSINVSLFCVIGFVFVRPFAEIVLKRRNDELSNDDLVSKTATTVRNSFGQEIFSLQCSTKPYLIKSALLSTNYRPFYHHSSRVLLYSVTKYSTSKTLSEIRYHRLSLITGTMKLITTVRIKPECNAKYVCASVEKNDRIWLLIKCFEYAKNNNNVKVYFMKLYELIVVDDWYEFRQYFITGPLKSNRRWWNKNKYVLMVKEDSDLVIFVKQQSKCLFFVLEYEKLSDTVYSKRRELVINCNHLIPELSLMKSTVHRQNDIFLFCFDHFTDVTRFDADEYSIEIVKHNLLSPFWTRNEKIPLEICSVSWNSALQRLYVRRRQLRPDSLKLISTKIFYVNFRYVLTRFSCNQLLTMGLPNDVANEIYYSGRPMPLNLLWKLYYNNRNVCFDIVH